MTAPEQERLAKAMARSDLGVSRREAERYIDEGRVVVNGSKVGAADIKRGRRVSLATLWVL
jgi:16S rRNA U516 pseudouridylate synthase RsuA-like enzyme